MAGTRARPVGADSSLRLGFPGETATDAELVRLRQQQAAFRQERERLDRENGWMAIPALAPAAVVLSLEAIAARAGLGVVGRAAASPHQLTKADPYLRVGDNYATRIGRRAHQAHKVRVKKKPGWDAETPYVGKDGRNLRPDTITPREKFHMELKPNTPSGRKAGAAAVKKYEDQLERKTRAIFYDPKDYR